MAYPGGERVEGFSNPTWVLVLVPGDRLGVAPFLASKLLGALFSLGALLPWRRPSELESDLAS